MRCGGVRKHSLNLFSLRFCSQTRGVIDGDGGVLSVWGGGGGGNV